MGRVHRQGEQGQIDGTFVDQIQQFAGDSLDHTDLNSRKLSRKTRQAGRQKIRGNRWNGTDHQPTALGSRHLLDFQLGVCHLANDRLRSRQERFS